MARSYSYEVDLAFFVVTFGYTKAEYEALTPLEAAFIKKAWEEKFVRDIGYINMAMINAVYNANRPKGRSFKKFWTKQRGTPTNTTQLKQTLEEVRAAEEKKGFDWLKKILKR